jgi:hypothetical protein
MTRYQLKVERMRPLTSTCLSVRMKLLENRSTVIRKICNFRDLIGARGSVVG